MRKTESKELDALILGIAKRYIAAIEDAGTLEARYSDSLDFHEVSVWSLKKALIAAYEAGLEAR